MALQILLAEDSKYYRTIMSTILEEWGYKVVVAENGIQALERIEQVNSPQLIILDWVMPEMNGLEVCRRIRASLERQYRYIILLTNMTGQENIISGLEAGADDYVAKPFNEIELKYRLKIGRRIIELENKLMHMAMTDTLTGLLNRRAFFERLEGEVQRCQRFDLPLSIMMLDIDNFKSVNDTYGHQVGDIVLQKVSSEINRVVRKYDFVGRYGGEELIVCLPGVDASLAAEIAERLRKSVEKLTIYLDNEDKKKINVTASFGYTIADKNTDMSNIDRQVFKADEGVYIAKKQGKNRVCRVE